MAIEGNSGVMDELKTKAVRSFKWSVFFEWLPRVSQAIIQLFLAKLLAPKDFGLIGTAIIVITFAQIFWDAGLAKALIQTNEPVEKAANIVFWVNALIGVIIYGLLFIFAPWIANFFNSPLSIPILRVMGIQIILLSLTSVQTALLMRGFAFRQLFWIQLGVAFIPALFSIPLAFMGYGVWALVTGILAGSSMNMILLWRGSKWHPSSDFDWRLALKLSRFGSWVVGFALIGWFMNQGDNLFVGKFIGIRELGIYQFGWTIVISIFGLVLRPFLALIYPTFSRLQGDMQAVRQVFSRVNRVVISLALPIGVGLLLVGEDVEKIFGEKWAGLGFVISLIGLAQGLGWLVGINSDIYRAIGRPDVSTKIIFANLLYYLPAFWMGAQLGFRVFVIIRLVVSLITIPIEVLFCARILGVSRLYIWDQGKPMIMAVIVMAMSVTLLKWGLSGWVTANFVVLIIEMAVGAAVYSLMLWLMDRSFMIQTFRLANQAGR